MACVGYAHTTVSLKTTASHLGDRMKRGRFVSLRIHTGIGLKMMYPGLRFETPRLDCFLVQWNFNKIQLPVEKSNSIR